MSSFNYHGGGVLSKVRKKEISRTDNFESGYVHDRATRRTGQASARMVLLGR